MGGGKKIGVNLEGGGGGGGGLKKPKSGGDNGRTSFHQLAGMFL